MEFAVSIIGSNSAVPAHDRHPSAQLVHYDGDTFLIDCGEGTQIRILDLGFKPGKISHIFISHLHGDHYYGLIGFITTYNLLGRTADLHIHCFPGLKDVIELQLNVSNVKLSFRIIWHFFKPGVGELIAEFKQLRVYSIPLVHRTPCMGFFFKEKEKPRKFDKLKGEYYGIPIKWINRIKEGEDYVTDEGKIIPNKELTLPAPLARSYAYITDTRFHPEILPRVMGADLLYHESTFESKEVDRAHQTYHCTSTQAATMAHRGKVRHLLLGHFSAKYNHLEQLLKEAVDVFPNTSLAEEGVTFKIDYPKE